MQIGVEAVLYGIYRAFKKYHGQEIFLTEALTREAIIAMDKAQGEDKPFFMYMSHYAVHAPIEKDERYYQKYLDKGLDEKEASYAALIEGMDKSLGDIMQHLKEKNLMDNTIILFMSDNGGLSVHSRGGEPHTHNKPLSSGKGSIHEGGIRVPMIVKWPGVTIPGSTNDNYLIIEDFYPSILEMAGVEDPPTDQTVDGKSFTRLLKNNSSRRYRRAKQSGSHKTRKSKSLGRSFDGSSQRGKGTNAHS